MERESFILIFHAQFVFDIRNDKRFHFKIESFRAAEAAGWYKITAIKTLLPRTGQGNQANAV